MADLSPAAGGAATPTSTEAMVVRALSTHGIAGEEIAGEFGVSRALISYIRTGRRHAKVRPDLPRWRSCEACVFWERRCTLGFPEPELLDDLMRAGTDCSAFMGAKP